MYSVLRIIPLSKWVPSVSWKDAERVLLFCGVIGAFIASSTGEIAEHLVNPDRSLVEMHSLFASLSTWFYGLLLFGEILALFTPVIISKLSIPPLTKFLITIEKILCNRGLSLLLALCGLIAISVTGLLGGVLVYGASADPVAPFVLKILGITY